VLSDDWRAPVLFLRQFGDDGARDDMDFPQTSEERLEQALGSVGPVIAIGRPGDKVPPPGAARTYVAHESWQEKVADYIDRAEMIALQIGDTPGIRWEDAQVVARAKPSRVVLILGDSSRYPRFVAENGDLFPKPLPDILRLPYGAPSYFSTTIGRRCRSTPRTRDWIGPGRRQQTRIAIATCPSRWWLNTSACPRMSR